MVPESGWSYERSFIEQWLKHHMCGPPAARRLLRCCSVPAALAGSSTACAARPPPAARLLRAQAPHVRPLHVHARWTTSAARRGGREGERVAERSDPHGNIWE